MIMRNSIGPLDGYRILPHINHLRIVSETVMNPFYLMRCFPFNEMMVMSVQLAMKIAKKMPGIIMVSTIPSRKDLILNIMQ
jgi:hypothetical protein